MTWYACAYACVQTYMTEANRNKTYPYSSFLKGIMENSSTL